VKVDLTDLSSVEQVKDFPELAVLVLTEGLRLLFRQSQLAYEGEKSLPPEQLIE